MSSPEIISNEKNIIVKKINDLDYSIEFESTYDPSSNLLEIVNNKILGSLLYELNKDLIKEYKKLNEYELLIFDTINSNLDNNYYLNFKYNIEENGDLKILNVEINNINLENFEKIEINKIIIYIFIKDNFIKFKADLFYNKELSNFKIDMVIMLLRKIIYRLNNYIK